MFIIAIVGTLFLTYYSSSQYVGAVLAVAGTAPSWGAGYLGGIAYAIYLVVVGTIFGLIILKFKNKITNLLRIMEGIFLALGSSFVFMIVLGVLWGAYLASVQIFAISLAIGISLVFIKNMYPKITNLIAIIAAMGTATVIGASFGFYAIVVLMLIIAVYDYIAVYVTKHMVAMANVFQPLDLAFMIGSRREGVDSQTKEAYVSRVNLGLGDLILPAMLIAGGLFLNGGVYIVVGMTIGAVVSLVYVMYLLRVQKKAMPAIPPLFIGCMAGFFVTWTVLFGVYLPIVYLFGLGGGCLLIGAVDIMIHHMKIGRNKQVVV